MEDRVYLLAVTRYIHLNPIKIAACRKLPRGERLQRLNAYRWSGYGGYADVKLARSSSVTTCLRSMPPTWPGEAAVSRVRAGLLAGRQLRRS